MTLAIAPQNVLVRDPSGHWYSIPSGLEQSFINLKETIINADFGSDEWYDANDELSDEFGEYIKG